MKWRAQEVGDGSGVSDEEAAEDDEEEDERVLVDDVHCILLPSAFTNFPHCLCLLLCSVQAARRRQQEAVGAGTRDENRRRENAKG